MTSTSERDQKMTENGKKWRKTLRCAGPDVWTQKCIPIGLWVKSVNLDDDDDADVVDVDVDADAERRIQFSLFSFFWLIKVNE